MNATRLESCKNLWSGIIYFIRFQKLNFQRTWFFFIVDYIPLLCFILRGSLLFYVDFLLCNISQFATYRNETCIIMQLIQLSNAITYILSRIKSSIIISHVFSMNIFTIIDPLPFYMLSDLKDSDISWRRFHRNLMSWTYSAPHWPIRRVDYWEIKTSDL